MLVQYLGWEGLLERAMATHSGILVWRTPRTEETGGLQSVGSRRVGHDQATNTHTQATKHESEKESNLPNITRLVNSQMSERTSLSRVRLFATPWIIAHQTPLSMEFSRQEYGSGLPFPSPGDLPVTGMEPKSPAL